MFVCYSVVCPLELCVSYLSVDIKIVSHPVTRLQAPTYCHHHQHRHHLPERVQRCKKDPALIGVRKRVKIPSPLLLFLLMVRHDDYSRRI